MYAHIIDKKWLYGGPWDLWLNRLEMIGEFIDKHEMKPIPAEHLPQQAMFFSTAEAMRGIRPIPFPGGLRSPHLHFKGDIYLMNPAQWKTFSGTVMKQYQERLTRAGTVSFRAVHGRGRRSGGTLQLVAIVSHDKNVCAPSELLTLQDEQHLNSAVHDDVEVIFLPNGTVQVGYSSPPHACKSSPDS